MGSGEFSRRAEPTQASPSQRELEPAREPEIRFGPLLFFQDCHNGFHHRSCHRLWQSASRRDLYISTSEQTADVKELLIGIAP